MNVIEQIPETIWERIFKYLDFQDLQSLDLTSKKFSQLASNFGFLQKCILKIYPKQWMIILDSNRKYKKIGFYKCDFLNTEALQILDKFQKSLVSLDFNACQLCNESLLRIMRLEKLESLEFFNVVYERAYDEQPLEIPPTLTEISVIGHDNHLTAIFPNRVTKLDILPNYRLHPNFLATQRNLKHLEVRSRDWTFLNYTNAEELGLRCETINFMNLTFQNLERSIPFISSLSGTLTQLALDSTMMQRSQIALLLNSLGHLESLELTSDRLRVDGVQFQRQYPNLKHLKLFLSLNPIMEAQQIQFFRRFPNLVELRLSEDSYISGYVLLAIRQTCLKLQQLQLRFPMIVFEEQWFPNLRLLEASYLDFEDFKHSRIVLKKFLYWHPLLEDITVSHSDEHALFFIVRRMTHLKSLTIHDADRFAEDAFVACLPYLKLLKQLKRISVLDFNAFDEDLHEIVEMELPRVHFFNF
jgi:hypothetical protein